ncbi:hypothetical protein [Corallococcus llansteffanensis]|uniref:Uncharacterized protein n=1 Tax=Corallococcus llansteffanensis TaxID=2316731 RepID=A0A3A8PIT9_9BACT|nr:hypothetical protein [Corallococcus llansteffanensis]RKH55939.1 hypothetical protein D7V93_21465 [Corallococcus llansteffanensis]
MTIKELRILPPLAIARLGAAPEPLDNYELEVPDDDPLGFRRLKAAPTFRVDPETGAISEAFLPSEIAFKSPDGLIRPVAPFLEVWAVTEKDSLVPLTVELLAQHGLRPSDVKWEVRVGNIKMYRRTGKEKDKVLATTGRFSDHAVHPLDGQCRNFREGKVLPLGSVRFIRPTEEFPEIRLRFTPAAGEVYGASAETPGPDGKPIPDENLPPENIIYDPRKGDWKGYKESVGPALTMPAQIYAGYSEGDDWVSRGYLDDECDGLVHVQLKLKGAAEPLKAFARIGAGPPAFAPDSFPVRTVADDLDQALNGPRASDRDATLEAAEDIVRRAFETIRLMNTAVMNGNTVNGQVDVASTMVRQDTADTGRLFEPIMAPSLVHNLTLKALHQNVFTALRGGAAPWFSDVLRRHDEIGDLSDKGRRKMPAMMRGADGRTLALTRRQVDIVRKAARRALFKQTPSGRDGGDTE